MRSFKTHDDKDACSSQVRKDTKESYITANISIDKGNKHKLSNDEHLARLKISAMNERNLVVIKTIIDTIAAFGNKAIGPITEIMNQSSDDSVKDHGLEVIKRIKILNPDDRYSETGTHY